MRRPQVQKQSLTSFDVDSVTQPQSFVAKTMEGQSEVVEPKNTCYV